MHTLAIDLSTARSSLALLIDGACRADEAWAGGIRSHQQLLERLPRFLATTGTKLADVGQFIVGVGPGSFTGIRSALAVANGLALPGDVPVRGLASAAAIAWDQLEREPAREVAVVGDARRQRAWFARYRRAATGLFAVLAPPAAVPLGELAAHTPAGARVVTSDWDRLGAVLPPLLPGRDLLAQSVYPTARALGLLAGQYAVAGLPLLPPQPLYLHPAVD